MAGTAWGLRAAVVVGAAAPARGGWGLQLPLPRAVGVWRPPPRAVSPLVLPCTTPTPYHAGNDPQPDQVKLSSRYQPVGSSSPEPSSGHATQTADDHAWLNPYPYSDRYGQASTELLRFCCRAAPFLHQFGRQTGHRLAHVVHRCYTIRSGLRVWRLSGPPIPGHIN